MTTKNKEPLQLYLVKRIDEFHSQDYDTWQSAVVAQPSYAAVCADVEGWPGDFEIMYLGPVSNPNVAAGVVCIDVLHG